MKRVGFRWLSRGSCHHPEAMTMKGGSLCSVEFPALVGVIEHPDRGTFLFDTGYDPAFLSATKPFPERLYRWTTPVRIGPELEWNYWLKDNSIQPADISGVIISHFHGDHVAGLHHLEGLLMFCARSGLNNLRKPGRFQRVRQGLLSALVPDSCDRSASFFEDAPMQALPTTFNPFDEGRDILGDGSLLAIELPGHCPGHWGLGLRNEDDQYILLAADSVWSKDQIELCRPPPRLTTSLLGDTCRYRKTLSALHSVRKNNTEIVILPSHCSSSARSFNQTTKDVS